MGLNVRHARQDSGSFPLVRVGLNRIALFFLLPSVFAGAASAQDLSPLVDQCASGGSPQLLTACQSSVLAAQAIRGGIALADRAGADLSGASSTIGKRLGSAPRVSVDLRLRMSRFAMPDILDGGTGVAAENSVNAYGMTGSMVVGLLDGFFLMPTVGGVFSLDLLASGSLLFLGESDGFLGDEGVLSAGGRLGIFRESFTLPGVTVSAVRSFGQSVRWTGAADGSAIDTDISTTSVRGTVGKNFFTFAVLGGVGWDWDHGDMGVQVPDPAIPRGRGAGQLSGSTTRRTVYFAGLSITRLVFQFSVEGGWATGYDGLAGYLGAYEPGAITPFVSVAGRLTI